MGPAVADLHRLHLFRPDPVHVEIIQLPQAFEQSAGGVAVFVEAVNGEHRIAPGLELAVDIAQ